MEKLKLISIAIITLLILTSCSKCELVGKVDAVIIDKVYEGSYTRIRITPIFNGKTTMMVPRTRRYPEKHLVRLEYKDMTIQVDNEELYNNVEVGDIVKVNHYKDEDKEKIEYEE